MRVPDLAPAALSLRLFGPFDARLHGAPLARRRSRKGEWLLALLVFRHGRPVERAWLAGMLWPESPPSQALALMRRELTDLRRALGSEAGRLHAPTSHTLCLDLTGADVDLVAFDQAVAQGDPTALERAVALYRSPLLEGCEEEWAFQERQAREQAFLSALMTLAAAARASGELEASEAHLRRAVGVDPLRESAQRELMQVLAVGGNYAAALQVYQELRLLLHRQMNTEPDTETTALFQQLRAEAREKAVRGARCPQSLGPVAGLGTPVRGEQASARRTASEPPLAIAANASDTTLCNLPLQLTSFIGREDEIAAIQQMLAAHRLVTLTGAGGCGKTRLALHVATQILGEFADGAWLVELAPLADPALVAQTVVSALGARTAPSAMNALEEARRPALTLLTEYLRQKKMLLILDNCEHLTDECARLVDTLLRACPNLRILATSRETLGAAGETAWRVPSLSLPDLKGELLPAALTQYEAIRLFVDRATAAVPTFQVTEKNAPALARVCHQLDGIPLAIELAAVRVKALPVEQLAARLDDQFRLLTGGSRTALPRQQTLRAAIDWSYDLLTEAERMLLRRLAVFAGGWSLETAEAVCGGEGVEEWEILDLLTQLVDKSLVQYEEHDGEGRYRLLEIIRQYSRARLLETGEAELLRRRHRDFFLALAERAEPELQWAEQVAWLKRLDLEQDNLRAALDWCLADEEGVEAGLRLAAALPRFWTVRGSSEEGADWLERVLARNGGSPAARAKALCQAGSTPWWAQGVPGAQTLLEESQALYRELGDQAGIAASLLHLGQVAERQGDLEMAQSHLEASRAISEQLTDDASVAASLLALGRLASRRDDYATARSHFARSLALHRRVGDTYGAALSLQTLGGIAWRQGDLAATRSYYTECLAMIRELEDQSSIPWSLTMLANVARLEGDLTSARSLFEESAAIHRNFGRLGAAAWSQLGGGNVALAQGDQAGARSLYTEVLRNFREANDREGCAFALERFATLAAAAGQPETVARLLGAAEALREVIQWPLPPVDHTEYYDRLVAETRIALGEKRYATAWAEGRAMTLEDAITFALQDGHDSVP